MQYKQAKEIGLRILKTIEPYCIRCDIAGSLRREKPDVGDIEICALPQTVKVDLFGGEEKRSPGFIHVVKNIKGSVIKGEPTGRYMRIDLNEGISLDLFMPESTDYFRQYVIRTGSADYSARVIATAWVKKGWRGTPEGLRLESECYSKDLPDGKKKWICTNKNPTLPPNFSDEYEFFQWLGLKWELPSKRYV